MALLAAIISAATAQNSSSGSSQTCEALSVDNISPLVVKAEYAVRGRLLARAMELEAVLKAGGDGAAALPFKRIVRCNIGNPQAVGQKPTTFVRQVLSLVMNPAQLSGLSKWAYPKDAIARAKHYLAGIPSLGAYSDSQGILSVRKEVADFIAARDGHPASPSDIFLTDGASAGVKALMQLLVRGPHDAVLVPVPQYPLYSAVTTLLNGTLAPYYLDEDAAWGVQEAELRRALTAAKAGGATTRALCVINPGNPTGQSLPRAAVESILRFAAKEKLVLMADEVRTAAAAAAQFGAQFGAQFSAQFGAHFSHAHLPFPAQVYQENVYGDAPPFVSFKKVLSEMAAAGDAAAGGVQLVSFHSTSKGFFGECGLRGGYFEMVNVDAEVRAQLLKLASISLCSNTVGQLATGLMVRPPAKGEPSHKTYAKERAAILAGLAARAQRIAAALNALPGVTCNAAEGAMYLSPRVRLPKAAVAAAAKQGMAADEYYSIKLLEATGLVVVPGSGFKQVEGTHHFRTTFLPPADMLDEVLPKLATFHTDFIAQHGGAK